MAAPFRVYRSLEELASGLGPSAVTIGNFDGVHAGHRRILRRVVECAGVRGLAPCVLTFDPHPTRVVAPQRAPRLLTTLEQRCELMEREGVGTVVILPFGIEIARLEPEEFIGTVLVNALGARSVLVGANFRFGRNQRGDTAALRELGERFGFTAEIVPPVAIRGRQVSSSAIRQAVEAGDVYRAGRMLERPYALEGEVVRGRGVGSRETVPTLNLQTAAEVLPRSGVYVTRTFGAAGSPAWPSVTNIGHRPTFGEGGLSIETFLLAPLDGAPPAHIRVEFLRRVRDERKFGSAAELKERILRDADVARTWFRRIARLRRF